MRRRCWAFTRPPCAPGPTGATSPRTAPPASTGASGGPTLNAGWSRGASRRARRARVGGDAPAHGAVYERGSVGAHRGARKYIGGLLHGPHSLPPLPLHRYHLLLRGDGAEPLPHGPAAALADVGHRADLLW